MLQDGLVMWTLKALLRSVFDATQEVKFHAVCTVVCVEENKIALAL